MAYLNLADNSFVSQEIREKMDFYLKSNYFPLQENTKTIPYKSPNDTSNQIISSIKKHNKALLKQINFLYLNDLSDWNVICVSDSKNPLIVLNIQQILKDYKKYPQNFNGTKEAIAYATIFGFLGIYFGARLCISCFGDMKHQGEYTTNMYYRYEELALYLFDKYKENFMLFITSADFAINKIYALGKKFVFSLAIMFFEKKISLNAAAKLLDLSEEETYILLNDYKNAAYVFYLNHKTEKGI